MNIRPAAVSGTFYPASSSELVRMMDDFLEQVARSHPAPVHSHIMMVPHAGYIYSGLTAAFAYHQLQPGQFKRVVLLGPTHRVPVYGLALPQSDTFATPLGLIPLDMEGMQKAATLPQVSYNEATHQLEHSLEVQLPFLQHRLGDFQLIPFAVGEATVEQVSQVIAMFMNEPDTLILISSDLSHFHDYEEARRIDSETCEAILEAQFPIHHQQACGATPLNGLLALLQQQSNPATLLDYRNSGDTAGGKDRVVGYASFAFMDAPQ